MKTVSKDTNIPIYARSLQILLLKEGQTVIATTNTMKYNLDRITQGLNQ